MATGDLSYDDARRWLAAHPVDGVSIGKLRRQALRLGLGSLPAMVEVLAHGTDDEVAGAFSVLYHHGVKVEREGDSPETCQYQITFPDGRVRRVHPDNFTEEDFDGENAPSASDEPSALAPGALRDLSKSWMSETILAVLTAGMIAGAVETSGVPRVIFIVAAVGAGGLLAWSLLLLTVLTFVAMIASNMGRRKRPGHGPGGP